MSNNTSNYRLDGGYNMPLPHPQEKCKYHLKVIKENKLDENGSSMNQEDSPNKIFNSKLKINHMEEEDRHHFLHDDILYAKYALVSQNILSMQVCNAQ